MSDLSMKRAGIKRSLEKLADGHDLRVPVLAVYLCQHGLKVSARQVQRWIADEKVPGGYRKVTSSRGHFRIRICREFVQWVSNSIGGVTAVVESQPRPVAQKQPRDLDLLASLVVGAVRGRKRATDQLAALPDRAAVRVAGEAMQLIQDGAAAEAAITTLAAQHGEDVLSFRECWGELIWQLSRRWR